MQDESMSALLDGECTAQETSQLLKKIEADPALAAEFSRMVLAREARRGTRIRRPDLDLSARVQAALEAEEQTPVTAPAGGAIRQLFGFRLSLPWQPFVGLAAAAGLTSVVLVLGSRAPQAPDSSPITGPAALVSVTPVRASVQSAAGTTTPDPVGMRLASEHDQQLAAYLRDHNRYRMLRGQGPHEAYRYSAVEASDRRPGR